MNHYLIITEPENTVSNWKKCAYKTFMNIHVYVCHLGDKIELDTKYDMGWLGKTQEYKVKENEFIKQKSRSRQWPKWVYRFQIFLICRPIGYLA